MNKKVDVDRVWLSKKTSWFNFRPGLFYLFFAFSKRLGLVSKEVSSLEDLTIHLKRGLRLHCLQRTITQVYPY